MTVVNSNEQKQTKTIKIRMKTLACISTLIGLLGSSAYATGSWSLAGDYVGGAPNGNNGVWSYGQVIGGVFSTLPWTPVSSDNTPGVYGVIQPDGSVGAFVYQINPSGPANPLGLPDYGVNAGQVSLESDWGSAAARWTAPSTGDYDIAVAIGGTQAYQAGLSGQGGTGNAFAQYAGLNINGNTPAGSFVNNVKSWNIDVSLLAGQSVTAYVLNPGYAGSGNTATDFTVTAVPEPATLISGLLMLLPFGASTLRILRRNRVA